MARDAGKPEMRLGLIVLALLAFTGCAQPQPTILRNSFSVHVEVTDKLPANTLGYATFYPNMNTCVVQLRTYPVCLLHEIRHCIEGNWHRGRESSEDC